MRAILVRILVASLAHDAEIPLPSGCIEAWHAICFLDITTSQPAGTSGHQPVFFNLDQQARIIERHTAMTTRRIGTVLALGALTMSAGTFQIAAADETHNFSANIGVVSNYMFRGLTQTDDGPAVQGGLD
ncbi:MAG TPA: TorF family putative porin, partial [Thiocapsa sp.]|nr:TorF family putative porin [Thiocapsa sp.]